MKKYGNRKRQGDPPVLAERLLCIEERVWEKILDVVEELRLRENREYVSDICSLELLIEEGNDEFETGNDCLQITEDRHPWWEKEHWGELLDERKLWGDITRESQRKLTKLKGR